MNSVVLMGRLTRDPEVRYTQSSDPVCIARYTLAVDRMRKAKEGEQTADFIPCVAFGKLGEHAEKYYRQGLKVCIRGRIQTGSYTNRDDQKVYTTDVVVESQEFAESKRSGSGSGQQAQGGGYGANQYGGGYSGGGYGSGQYGGQQAQDSEGFMNIPDGVDDEELPFN